MTKKDQLENPVLFFSSAVYKCETPVRRLFHAGSVSIERGENKIREGLRLSLHNRVPTNKILEWLMAEGVRQPKKWAAQYERLAARPAVAKRVFDKEITWNQAAQQINLPRPARSKEAIGREYIHKLAVWIVITRADPEITIGELRIEIDKVTSEKALAHDYVV
jgi:hypothetical protein